MSDASEQPARKIVTRPGAFGARHALMIIVRRWTEPAQPGKERGLKVENFVLQGGNKRSHMDEAMALKAKLIAEPDFASFTLLEFIEEARIHEEAPPQEKSKIIIPNARDRQRFGQ